MITLQNFLKNNILVTDGAFGTYYTSKIGDSYTLCETANIENPNAVYQIHKEYIEAGAQLIRTNTFAANTYALQVNSSRLKEIISAGCELAYKAASESDEEVYIAGSIGPIATSPYISSEEVMEEYYLIIDTFAKLDIKIILFETFSSISLIKKLSKYVINTYPHLEIICNLSLDSYGYTQRGVSAKRVLKELSAIEGLVIGGFNCGIGVGHLYNVVGSLDWEEDFNLVTIPNASYPEKRQNRLVYMHNPKYFAKTMIKLVELGAKVIGGCCGTTPEHIKVLTMQLAALNNITIKKKVTQPASTSTITPTRNNFYQKLLEGKKPIAVELDPPFNIEIEKFMDGAHSLSVNHADIITIADSPLGKLRLDSMMMGTKILKEAGIATMPHICCRDKNIIALKSQLFAGYIEGIRNFLFITGDPVPSSERSEISSVFNLNSIQLMELANELNLEHFQGDPIYYGAALNPNKANLDKELKRMNAKVEAGVSYFLTQPIYTEQSVQNIEYVKNNIDTHIVVGIMPLVSIRNARFIQNQIPGIHIPDEVVNRFNEDMTKEEAEEIGIEIALEMVDKVKDIADGYYFIVPFNRVSMINKIISYIKSN